MMDITEKIYEERAGEPKKRRCNSCGKLQMTYGFPAKNHSLCLSCWIEKNKRFCKTCSKRIVSGHYCDEHEEDKEDSDSSEEVTIDDFLRR